MRCRVKHSVTANTKLLRRWPSPADGRPNVATSASASQNAICAPNVIAATPAPPRLITKRELSQIVPYTSQHILRLEKMGKFPRRVQVGANRVAWLLSEIEAWVASRVAERDSFIR